MSSDPSSPIDPPETDSPTASLSVIRVTKRRAALAKKRGDITSQLTGGSDAPTPLTAPRESKATTPASTPPTAAPAAKAVLKLTVDPPDEQEDTAAAMPPILRLTVDPSEKPGAEGADAPKESIDEIIDYWDSLRGDRAFPSLNDIDRAFVTRCWSNCVLLAVGDGSGTPKITRLGEPNGDVEYTAMVTDWILSRGRNSALKGEAMEEEKRFPVSKGNARYSLLLLPLSSNGVNCDNVLCHICRGEELSAGEAFKRWLNS